MNESATSAPRLCILANTEVASAVENLYIPDIRTAIVHSLVAAICGNNVLGFTV